jgi:hypothetical protein
LATSLIGTSQGWAILRHEARLEKARGRDKPAMRKTTLAAW